VTVAPSGVSLREATRALLARLSLIARVETPSSSTKNSDAIRVCGTSLGAKHWTYAVAVHYCWQNRVIQGTPNVTPYMAYVDPTVKDNGESSSDTQYFYDYWQGVSHSGYAVKDQRSIDYCETFCYQHKDPWIHVYVHGNGTFYFHTGD
jgi:hypothetical protein